MKRFTVFTLAVCTMASGYCIESDDIRALNRLDAVQQQLQQQQAQYRAQRFNPGTEINNVVRSEDLGFPSGERPCYVIRQIRLQDYAPAADHSLFLTPSRFSSELQHSLKDFGIKLPYCFGAEGIGVLLKGVQNRIIAAGYITTRIVIPEQDLKRGELLFTLIPGKIGNIKVEDRSRVARFTPLTLLTATAFKRGDLLNIRHIEQSLENLKRLPTADANIEILPSEGKNAAVGESDLKITYAQAFPFRLNLGLEDSGSKSTGKWQGAITLFADNLFSANDLFYTAFTHSIKRRSDEKGTRSAKNLSFYYSVPFGYWALTAYHSDNRYRQEVFSSPGNSYIYSGASETDKLALSYLFYRDGSRRASISAALWSRQSANYIDDSEIEVQRRRMAGWEAGITYKEYLADATLELNLSYKRGTGVRGSLPAPEEMRNEGSSRPRIISAAVSLKQPFSIGAQPWQFYTAWTAQWNLSALILQDRFSLGGRYSVRGFDGELSLYGERGWLWRNELAWNPHGKSSLYFALDGGLVRGRLSPAVPTGQRYLIGTAAGVRGGWKGFYYDFFIGTPLSKPKGFKTSYGVTGFNLGYSF
ncbi:hemolysin activation/secretion protein [Mesocricetibacter intestinalis]|uniref:Hemolysin activation/secretion protein n=1 Tax=Mesocricetibacter intestinalis TaxID=1521930 RepID=A0A4R6VEP5_9PAST|nr:ShlB/FhaC/HecB family hemolysin secretion/activation protein [Mesocricetibacter intestinalis]TDQ58950.1 hemolysin activation/secretion protein [Mesocricetibacter intestinalis]